MRILFVTDVKSDMTDENSEKGMGGAERVVNAYIRGCRQRGHHVEVLSRDSNGSGLITPRKGVLPTLQRLTTLFLTFGHISRQSPPHVINFHQPFSAFFVLLHPCAHSIPKVYTFHSSASQEYATRITASNREGRLNLWHRFNVFLRKWTERYAIKKSRCVVVLSDFSRQILRDLHRVPPPEVVLIPGGADLERFHPAPNRSRLKEELAPGFSHLLFTVRNLVPRMGLENLLHAMNDIVREYPRTLLIVGGDGPLRKTLKDLTGCLGLEENIRFEGFIPEERLAGYYQAADLFVLPTRTLEGFGLVTVEALACATPVVGTPVGGTVEILRGLDARLICEGIQSHHLASGIRYFLAHPEEAEGIRGKCRSYVEEYYDWNRIINRLEKVLVL